MGVMEKPLPHSETCERWLLGAILSNANEHQALFDFLRPEDFYPPGNPHSKIFKCMSLLRDRGQVPDLLSVHDALTVDGGLEAVGGIAYLAGLADGIPKVAPIHQWARTLRGYTRRREIISVTDSLKERAFEGSDSSAELLDSGIDRLSTMARELDGEADDGSSYKDAATNLLGELREGTSVRIFTGVDTLDRMLGGLLPGELWIFAASTGVGKTVLAQQTRRRACVDGHHVLYASGEMKATHLQRRELAAHANLPQGKMRRPDAITEEEFSRLIEAAAGQCDVCRILDGELDLLRIRRAARRMKSRSGLALVVIDYDELVAVQGENEIEEQRNLARAAKSLGMELDCAVILVSQLRKALAGEDVQRPTLQSIYGSGAKTKHSTGVLLVDRPWVRELSGDETDAQLFVLKNRDGRLGRIPCHFDVRKLEFLDATGSGNSSAEFWDAKAQAAGRDFNEPREAEE
jgi:replicative DNA helicase